MRKILFLVTILLCFSGHQLSAQDFKVPKYSFKTADDYAKYDKDIVAAAEWLRTVPLNEQLDKRKKVSAFVFDYVSGSPDVDVTLTSAIFEMDKKNPGMMMIYASACAEYVINNNRSDEGTAKVEYALKVMIDVYKAGVGIKKDKMMQEVIKSFDDGTIEDWISNNIGG